MRLEYSAAQPVVRREPVYVLLCVVSALLNEELAHGAVRVVGHPKVHGGVALRVLVVDVGAASEHKLHKLLVAVLGADEQQRVALVVLAVHWEVGVERVLKPFQPPVSRLRMWGKIEKRNVVIF